MTIRHTRNATTRTHKRHCMCETSEVVALDSPATDPRITEQENNSNLARANVSSGNPIAYSGRDHIGVGVDQYDANP